MALVSTFFLSACLAWFRGEPNPSLQLQKFVRSGTSEQVQSALRAGANPNSFGPDGRTPLMVAAENGDTAFIELLIARKARLDLRDRRGRTALDLARTAGQSDASAALVGARAPGTEARFTLRLPDRETRTFPTAPFPERDAACKASVAMADIALAQRCPNGMLAFKVEGDCACESYMRGVSCKQPVTYACAVPRKHGGLPVVRLDERGAHGGAAPGLRLSGGAFVIDARPAKAFLRPRSARSSIEIVVARRDAQSTVVFSTAWRGPDQLYTVRPRGDLGPGDYMLAIVEDDGTARLRVLWLARIQLVPAPAVR